MDGDLTPPLHPGEVSTGRTPPPPTGVQPGLGTKNRKIFLMGCLKYFFKTLIFSVDRGVTPHPRDRPVDTSLMNVFQKTHEPPKLRSSTSLAGVK